MNTPAQAVLPIPVPWLRAGWVMLMIFMIIALVLGSVLYFDVHVRSFYLSPDPESSSLAVLYLGIFGIVLALLIFVMFASTVIFWKAEGQTGGVLLAFTLLIYWTTDSTPFDMLTQPDVTPLFVYFREPVLMMRAAALPLTLGLLFTFPDGRFSLRWSRWLLLGYTCLTALYLIFPTLPTNTIYGSTWRQTSELSFIVAVVPFLAGIYAQLHRYQQAEAEVRNQMKWILLGMVVMVVGVMLYYGVYAFFSPPYMLGDAQFDSLSVVVLEALRQFIQLVVAVVVPILCFMIAIFRYHLWSADPIINRALVYSTFIGILSFTYFISIIVIGLFANTINFFVSIPVTLFILIIFQPLREQIERTVDRLMFGDRSDPLAILSQLDAQITLTEPADRALSAIAAMLVETLKVRCVLMTVNHNGTEHTVITTYGRASGRHRVTRFPMAYGEQHIGQVALYQDVGDRPFTPIEQQLIEMVARQTALIIRTIQLNLDLQQSRQNLVSTREEERRRLRRDLHDGLGPSLASHTLKVGKARTLIPKQPETASTILQGLEVDLNASLAEIRRLVESLRPAILDQLGLSGAVRTFMAPLIEQTQSPTSTVYSLEIEFEQQELPAAVELAAYRIITEAVTNVLRHAHASMCNVHIDGDGMLNLSIRDNGVGFPAETRYGVGLNSMRERAEEVGGTFHLVTASPGGTQVVARLPLS